MSTRYPDQSPDDHQCERVENETAFLRTRGILIDPEDETGAALKDELTRRGWSFELEHVPDGYQCTAHKQWYPTERRFIKTVGWTAPVTFVLALSEAMRTDEELGKLGMASMPDPLIKP